MGQLRLPEGAKAGYRIETEDAFGRAFSINIYGVAGKGWFVASYRHPNFALDTVVQQLPKGEWATLLHHIDRCGFWSLPEDGSHLADPNLADLDGEWATLDGEWLTVAGRSEDRHHRIRRFIWREAGLEAVLSFARRVSGWFARHPRSGFWVLRAVQ